MILILLLLLVIATIFFFLGSVLTMAYYEQKIISDSFFTKGEREELLEEEIKRLNYNERLKKQRDELATCDRCKLDNAGLVDDLCKNCDVKQREDWADREVVKYFLNDWQKKAIKKYGKRPLVCKAELARKKAK